MNGKGFSTLLSNSKTHFLLKICIFKIKCSNENTYFAFNYIITNACQLEMQTNANLPFKNYYYNVLFYAVI